MATTTSTAVQVIPAELIERRICVIRGQKVMLDSDLAGLYQVQTFRLNEAVKRNINRFPQDFMLQLTHEEVESLTSQIAISKPGRGGRRSLPYAFTEHAVAMLSSVLSSDRAVELNILIIRAFVRLREYLASHADLAQKVAEHSAHIDHIYDCLHQLQDPPLEQKQRIGFIAEIP